MKQFNILKDKVQHLNKINTISGGVAMLQESLEENNEGYFATLRLPSLSSEAFRLVLDQNRLLVYADIGGEDKPIQTLLRVFPIPYFVDVENIRANHQGEELIINAPFKEGETGGRREIRIER